MNLEVVSIDDVYPNENNPRKKFEGIKELAASFDLNKERPGEPFIPPILVRDGGIYHIVDGERRYRAMQSRKLAKFTANVCEDFDEANALVAAMATDDKQPLSDIEKSRGVQQMLLLGVDPTSVDKATKGKNRAKRVNHAMVLVDDAAEDMSLDRLLAIDEFADDKHAVKALTNCTEKEWPKIADRLRIKKKRQLEYSVLRKELVKRGWKIVGHQPEGYKYRTYIEYSQIDFVAENYQKSLANGAVFVLHEWDFERKAYAEMFVPIKENEDPEEAKRNQELDEIRAQLDHAAENRKEWIVGKIKNNDPCPNVEKQLYKAIFQSFQLNEFEINEHEPLCMVAKAIGYLNLPKLNGMWVTEIYNGKCTSQGQYENFRSYLEPVLACILDGYEPCNWEKELYDKCAQVKAPESKEM
ncbi:MAG: ParB N-terminal domain-containing protein [Eggerthellaceae bacterium]|nr:ParB N-terminal domain-containing protein [Eggerthellaceae bacterium]